MYLGGYPTSGVGIVNKHPCYLAGLVISAIIENIA
jgi:hypothetical protein